MNKHFFILAFLIVSLIFADRLYAAPKVLAKIPVQCDKVEMDLKSIKTPAGFKISVYKAHQLSMKPDGIIKPCASKLEQVIYFDNKYYYFTNSILFYGKTGFPNKFVRVSGITGETKSTF